MPLTNTSTGELVTAAWLNAIVDRVNSFLVTATGGIWTGTVQKVIQSARGVRLRTHYNALAAPSQLALMGVDEVVMSDGVRYQPPSTLFPLVADITLSGLGGLDTGTEATDTWYESYLIGKSSTSSTSDLRHVLHRSKRHSVEMLTPGVTDTSLALRKATGTSTDRLAQGVQLTAAGPLTHVDVIMFKNGTISGTVWFELQTSSGSDATGTVLGTTNKIDANGISAVGAQVVRFMFPVPPTVATGTQYHMVFQGDYVRSDTNNVLWYGLTTNSYSNGVARQYNGAAWSNATGVLDFWLRAYVTRDATALTMPAGYDQAYKLGYVYNNSAGNFERFRQYGTKVMYLDDHLMVNASTSTIEVLTDLSTVLPPQTLRVYGAAQNTGTAGAVQIGVVPDGYTTHGSTFSNSAMTQQPTAGSGVVTGLSSDVITDTQAVYFRVGSGTGYFWVTGFEWGG